MKAILPLVPAYCRVSRMIRDFSGADIVIGNKTTNLRQIVETDIGPIQEIRSGNQKWASWKFNFKNNFLCYQRG